MSMTRCDDLIEFVDGELDPERAAGFRTHLTTCESCRACLVEALQLTVRLSTLTPPPAVATHERPGQRAPS